MLVVVVMPRRNLHLYSPTIKDSITQSEDGGLTRSIRISI